MSAAIETPLQTPKRPASNVAALSLSTPLFVPPSPVLKQLGYGTGKKLHIILLENFNST